MVGAMDGFQLVVVLSTTAILVLSVVLAGLLTLDYMRGRRRSHIFWSAGMWLFSFGVLLETLFALGIYSNALIGLYLFVVALLVEMLAMGSMQLIASRLLKRLYAVFVVVISAFVAYSVAVSHFPNIIQTYVVFGPLPLLVVVFSSLATFPAVAILIIIALLSYSRRHSYRMASIIIGVIVVSVAGTLYIAAMPEFLYISEFIGILLLWLGFVDFKVLRGR